VINLGVDLTEHLVDLVVATGAIGTAAFGIVEGLKTERLGVPGFPRLRQVLGGAIWRALESTYGSQAEQVLREYYRQDRRGAIGKALRQGIRVGLRSESAAELVEAIGRPVDASALSETLARLERGEPLTDADRSLIGRFELAADSRIDAALTLADARYVWAMRGRASLVSIALAVVGTWLLGPSGQTYWSSLALGGLIGIAAVPIAPVAKDLASGLRSALGAASAARRLGG
jgi:hypothetical protein